KMKVVLERGAIGLRAPTAVPTRQLPISSTIALNKNAFPTRQHDCRRTIVQFSPVFLRRSSSANQAFVRFAVTSSAAFGHRAHFDQRFGTFQPAWLSPREPLFRPTLCRGPGPVFMAGT